MNKEKEQVHKRIFRYGKNVLAAIGGSVVFGLGLAAIITCKAKPVDDSEYDYGYKEWLNVFDLEDNEQHEQMFNLARIQNFDDFCE